MRDAPTTAIPKALQQHVLDAEGRVVDPKAYVFAVIEANARNPSPDHFGR
jgi:hypothetical protein